MKEQRLMRIRALVSQQEIETQEELVRVLQESGLAVTQATISRDIKELQLIKVVGSNGRYKYAIPVTAATITLESLRRKLSEVFLSQARTGNLVVLKVLPGNAQAMGAMIDNMRHIGLLGTICGDDTILLVCADEACALRILDTLLSDT